MDFSVEIAMLGAVGVELAEISIGLKTIGVIASSVGISIIVMAIKSVVMD